MTYGQLASFIKFYVDKKKFGYSELKVASKLMHYSKHICDSAAHSRPILLNVIGSMQFGERKFPTLQLKEYLRNAKVDKYLANTYLTNIKVHDICCVLYLHDNYVKGRKMRLERKKELKQIFFRASR